MDAHSLYEYNDWYGRVIDKEWMYFDWKYRLTDLQCSDYRVIRIWTRKNTRCSLVRCSSARCQTVKRQLNKKPADEDCRYWVWLSVYCCQAKTKMPSMIRWLTSNREPLFLTPRISYDATALTSRGISNISTIETKVKCQIVADITLWSKRKRQNEIMSAYGLGPSGNERVQGQGQGETTQNRQNKTTKGLLWLKDTMILWWERHNVFQRRYAVMRR